MADVSIRQVSKSFGKVEVLKDICLDVADGDFVVLVGPSGCGKSTLLRTIAGLERTSSGTISIDAKTVNDIEPKDRDIAMVFQNYALYPHMTVSQNMGFALSMRKVARNLIETRLNSVSKMLGLDSLLSRLPKQLSGGQRQRVAMGRALVRSPKVFLFDEPLSNLDAKLRVKMRAEIRDLHRRLEATTIYVTHDQIEAMTMADKVVVMRNGEVEQVGRPLEVYDAPDNVFVAEFLGSPSMNLIEGRSKAGGFVLGDGTTILVGSSEQPIAKIGIRPEKFMQSSDGFDLTVQVVEPTGSETLIVGQIGGETTTVVFRERLRAEPGDRLTVRVDPEDIHLFDETGRRIRR